jgi:hypothetical protein
MSRSAEIEIKINGQWKKVKLEDALAKNEKLGRCPNPECQKPAKAYRGSASGKAAHLHHLERNRKCYLSDHHDPGIRMAPRARAGKAKG